MVLKIVAGDVLVAMGELFYFLCIIQNTEFHDHIINVRNK